MLDVDVGERQLTELRLIGLRGSSLQDPLRGAAVPPSLSAALALKQLFVPLVVGHGGADKDLALFFKPIGR